MHSSGRPLLGVLLATLILAACSSDSASSVRTLGAVTFNDHGTKDVKGTTTLELEADSFYFNPTFLRGAPGQTLKLTLANESGVQHNFSLPTQQVDTDIAAKGKAVVDVTIPASGVVQFFCKFHTGQGMNGELLAGDAAPQAPTTKGPAGAIPQTRSMPYSPWDR